MKKIIFLSILAIAYVFIAAGGSLAAPPAATNHQSHYLEIIIQQGPVKKAPRSINMVPMLCTYNAGAITLHFIKNIGNVVIVITDQSTGEQYVDYVDSTAGSTTVAMSNAEGDYVIQIETESGVNYFGYFSL